MRIKFTIFLSLAIVVGIGVFALDRKLNSCRDKNIVQLAKRFCKLAIIENNVRESAKLCAESVQVKDILQFKKYLQKKILSLGCKNGEIKSYQVSPYACWISGPIINKKITHKKVYVVCVSFNTYSRGMEVESYIVVKKIHGTWKIIYLPKFTDVKPPREMFKAIPYR